MRSRTSERTCVCVRAADADEFLQRGLPQELQLHDVLRTLFAHAPQLKVSSAQTHRARGRVPQRSAARRWW